MLLQTVLSATEGKLYFFYCICLLVFCSTFFIKYTTKN
jgi:hypothetical protein